MDNKKELKRIWNIMSESYLAIDIGASSGRHILGKVENGKLITKEIYRFPNGAARNAAGRLCWDIPALWEHILAGLRRCKEIGEIPGSVGIDTWGVDFVLLDADNLPVGDFIAYRDEGTLGMDGVVDEICPPSELYARTGIQKQIFNTIYQLTARKKNAPDQLERAEKLLFIPDYLHFLLTGIPSCEYTEASTSGLLSTKDRDWDFELIDRLGLPRKIFQPLSMPGTTLGQFSDAVAESVGFRATVVLPATHDTGSAVLAVPEPAGDALYLSSGTWSLMGVERPTPDTDEASRLCNFTNEGGYGGSYRYLKNIMGLWIIQSLKKETGFSFWALMNEAAAHLDTPLRIDVDDPSLLAPASMIDAILALVGKDELCDGELFAIVYLSLAECYRRTLDQIQSRTGKNYSCLHIIGGGSKDELLNRLTAEACGIPVIAGPSEATAIGNLLCQMIAGGCFASAAEARACVLASGELEEISC